MKVSEEFEIVVTFEMQRNERERERGGGNFGTKRLAAALLFFECNHLRSQRQDLHVSSNQKIRQ